jgi:succinate dehydrogenase/fumarate reductase flavoprotein subunit
MKNAKKHGFLILAGLLIIALPSCASGASSGSAGRAGGAGFLSTVSWDAEYDVIVVGFGGAGAVTAITAADAGAKVLILEKAPQGEEGGNTRYSAQAILTLGDRQKGLTYFKGLRGQYDSVSDKMLETLVDGFMENRAWLTSMGSKTFGEFPLPEFPELPGADTVTLITVDNELFSAQFFNLLRRNVLSRSGNIDVWYSAPGKELIQDNVTKTIHGVKAELNGKLVNIRAKNGVVLACGGFENNEKMLENFTQNAYAFPIGNKYNTGDGVIMGMRAGAALWHMSTLSGPYINFKDPNMPISYNLDIQMNTFGSTGFTRNGVIFVGSDGSRFINEAAAGRHGHINNAGTWVSMQIPTPCYMVFDDAARLAKRIYPSWSDGSVDEINKGWVIKADSIAELARKINIPPANLEAEIAAYNRYCASGYDPQFKRNPADLKPVNKGPYYAIEMSPTILNTQGGPERNENAEVISLDGGPIPHLYSAGELGSIYSDAYNGGGNLGECIVFGRIAGKNAAQIKNDVTQDNVLTKPPVSPPPVPEITAGPGEYLGTGIGISGELIVRVKMEGRRIVSIAFAKINETVGICDKAVIEVPRAIIAKQSTDVDTITGATVTSRAIITAVNDALSKAK